MAPTDPHSSTSGWTRLFWLIPAAVATFGLLLSFEASPSPTGMGAASRFNPAPCSFLVEHGYPCPGCGTMSSLASMARLDFAAAASANPFGVLAFMLMLVLLGVSIWGGVKNLPVIDTLYGLNIDVFAGLLLASMLLTWLVRVGKHFLL